jgi:hypothetical protein
MGAARAFTSSSNNKGMINKPANNTNKSTAITRYSRDLGLGLKAGTGFIYTDNRFIGVGTFF